MTETLARLESEVEEARAKLARDLALLRTPQTYREFGEDLKSEAQFAVQRVVEDLKSRAAANPTAVLAIGAGIGWRLFKHPPIAAALIGAGVLGLWRTKAVHVNEGDFLTTAQGRLREQVGEAMDTVKDYAVETAESARDTAASYARSARDSIQELAASAAETAGEAVGDAREAAAEIPDRAINAAERTTSQVRRAIADENFRDQILLGAAGLAVTAALGIAYRRQTSDHVGRET